MKNTWIETTLGVAKLSILNIMILGAASVYAQDFDLDDDYVSSDQMDIDGDFSRRKDFSKGRKRLENRTNDLVDKKLKGFD